MRLKSKLLVQCLRVSASVRARGLLLGAAVSQKKFLGSGNALSFSLQSSSSTKEARFSYTDPYYTIDGVSRGVDLYFAKTDFDDTGTADYSTDETGLGLTFGYPISDEERVSANFAVQNTNLDAKASGSRATYTSIPFLPAKGIAMRLRVPTSRNIKWAQHTATTP